EFVFVDPTVETQEAAGAVASRMLAAIGTVFDLRGHEIVITASIGIALIAEANGDAEALIQGADAAMYDAKAHDRNNARFYSPALQEKTRGHLEMEGALRRAFANGELELHYQPKLDIATGAVAGVEALLRWNSAEHGRISPDQFIPV